ncbi:hypothetical protein K1X45_13365 [Pseudochrobactrum sp. Wa41.01b-1]|nr:hypothetical protein [Pseudochrobactrum sp. Wa41.01b-1]QYM72450.1 hypothetical protein K1X45_13365 [Pseudochrobactrum sp. Wa41.01b-1]
MRPYDRDRETVAVLLAIPHRNYPDGLVTSAMGAPILIILARRGGRLNS